jgi:hypothetical protein
MRRSGIMDQTVATLDFRPSIRVGLIRLAIFFRTAHTSAIGDKSGALTGQSTMASSRSSSLVGMRDSSSI